MASPSSVRWYPKKDQQKCGYCKSPSGSIMFGMWAYSLKVEEYQNLIDRGWRRSGHYCYKPVMDETCCPLYTIRCRSLEFQPTKSQKKVMKKLNKFLKTGVLKEREKRELSENETEEGCEERIINDRECPKISDNIEEMIKERNFKGTNTEQENHDKTDENQKKSGVLHNSTDINVAQSDTNPTFKRKAAKTGLGPDPNRPPCKKAKIIRQERKMKKLGSPCQEIAPQPSKSEGKSLEEFLNDFGDDDKHKLSLKLIDPNNSPEWKKYERLEFDLYRKYQNIIHNDPPHKNNLDGFLRFLVKTPLKRQVHPDHKNNPRVPSFGSYHQQYWLDDKLIAVGVIDILPKCVSAVYFFYDPDYRELTLGTYGALKEVQFARELYPTLGIPYYYMGFYVHSCRKMRYKGNIHPSDLLCPETCHWFPIEKCVDRLDETKYCRFNEDQSASDSDECTREDLDSLKIIAGNMLLSYKTFKRTLDSEEEFRIMGDLIGKKTVKSLILIVE